MVVEEVSAESGQICRIDQSVSVDALALVHPQLNQIVGLLDSVLLGLKHALEHVRQVTHVEFVVEIDGCFSESALHILMQTQRRLDQWGKQLLHIALKLVEMLVEERAKDNEKRLRFRELDSLQPEVSLKTRVHHERSSSGVHGSHIQGRLDVFKGEFGAIVPMLVIFVLAHESNSRLRFIFVQHWHVQIVNEIDELILANGSISASCSLLELLLENVLEQSRVSEVVKVNNLLKILVSGRCQLI